MVLKEIPGLLSQVTLEVNLWLLQGVRIPRLQTDDLLSASELEELVRHQFIICVIGCDLHSFDHSVPGNV